MKRILAMLAIFCSGAAFAATSSVPMSSDAKTHGYSIESFIPLIIIFALFYLFFFMPQRRRQKQLKNMLASLEKGAEVSTNSGLIGTIDSIANGYVGVEVAKGVVVKMQQDAVTQVLPKGTIKSL